MLMTLISIFGVLFIAMVALITIYIFYSQQEEDKLKGKEGEQVQIGYHYEPLSRHLFDLPRINPIGYPPKREE